MYLAQSFRRPRDGAESQCNYRRIEGPCPKWKVLCVGRHYEDGSIRSRCAAASKRLHRNVGIENGIVFNGPNRLYAGHGKGEPVDEIRHEENAGSQFRLD